jgi:hypothetical protein
MATEKQVIEGAPAVGVDSREVGIPCAAYLEMEEDWQLIHDLRGGTQAMRDNATDWLPKEPNEGTDAWQARIKRSYLLNAYDDAIDQLTAKPFSKPVTEKSESGAVLPEQLRRMADNPCKDGRDLTQISKAVFDDGVDHGLVHIYVDYPALKIRPNVQEERDGQIQPYLVHVSAPNMLGWLYRKDASGNKVLTQIRIREYATVASGDYGSVEVETIRVVNERWIELWEKIEDKLWKLKEVLPKTNPTIPLATLYFNRTGFMTAKPALINLAWRNLEHFQSASDQRNILRFARCGFIHAAGFSPEELDEIRSIGAAIMVAGGENSKIGYVEHKGTAIAAGKEDLERIELQMEMLKLQPTTQRSGNVTATERVIDAAQSMTNIQAWIRATENAQLQWFQLATTWNSETFPEDYKFDIFSEFGLTAKAMEDLEFLLKACVEDKIPVEVLLSEVKRRSVIDEVWTVEGMMELLDAAGPTLPEKDDDDDLKDEGDEGE